MATPLKQSKQKVPMGRPKKVTSKHIPMGFPPAPQVVTEAVPLRIAQNK